MADLRGRKRRRSPVPAILVSAVFFISPAHSHQTPPASPTKSTESTESTESIGSLSPNTLLESADAVLKNVSKLRELKVLRPVKKGVVSREEISKYIQNALDKEYPVDEVRAEEIVLKRLGLIPPDFQYREYVVHLLIEQLAGFYDIQTGKFNIADWLPSELQLPTMAHELTHALQDQHFNAKKLMARVPGNDDSGLARSALLEGDAIAVMMDYTLQPMGIRFTELPSFQESFSLMEMMGEISNALLIQAPSYIRNGLLFPYTSGLEFVKRVKKGRSWSAVDLVYSNPPASTEQVLHPEKYMGKKDVPSEARLPLGSALGLEGWRESYRNVLGEFGWREVFRQALTEEKSNETAAGWDGDQVLLLEKTGVDPIIVTLSAWDSQTDAYEFASGIGDVVYRMQPAAIAGTELQKGVASWTYAGNRVVVIRDQRSVITADGPNTIVTTDWATGVLTHSTIRYR